MGITYSDPDVAADENIVQIAALTPTDNAVIIGNGTAWTTESGSTLLASLGLAIGSDVMAYDADLAAWAGVNPADYLTTAAAASTYLTTSAAALAYQPLDADLTAWAGVNPSSYSTTAQIAAAYQPLDSDLTAWAAVNPSSYSTTAQIAAAYQPLDADLTSWAAVTRAAGFDAFAATPSSANLRTLLSDESGSGALLFAGGALGTPASGVLTNCTGLPNASVVGLGTAAVKNTGTSGNNVPLMDGANTWSGQQTFSGAIQALFSASTPRTDYYETDGGSNGKLWSWIADTGVFYLQTRTDADVFGAAPIAITRSGTTVSSIALAATALSLSGVTSVTGATLSSPTLSGTVAGSPTFSGNPVYTGIPRLAAFYVGADSDMYIYESATNTLTLRAGGSGTETYLTIAPSGVVQIGGVNVMTVAGGTFTAAITAPQVNLNGSNGILRHTESGGDLYYDAGAGGASAAGHVWRSSNSFNTLMRLFSTGGLNIGSPTGGDKGAGTLNCVAAYDDNSLLTCYIVEAWKYGDIDLNKWDDLVPNREHPAQYETVETGETDDDGKPITEQRVVTEAWTETRRHEPARGFAKVAADRLDIDKFAQFVWENERLPAFPAPDRWRDMYAGNLSAGDLIQRLWETVEVMAVHSIEARKRELAMVARIEALEAAQ